jgi:nucleotide-binding universal stress UspA family protein
MENAMPAVTERQPPTANHRRARSAGRESANPALKGPVVLASRGSADAPAPAIVARQIADRIGRELNVVSVVEPVIISGLPGELQAAGITIDREALRARQEDIAGGEVARILGDSDKWSASVTLGYPAGVISDVARSADATFIVVGASPHRRLRRIIAGQRASQILHQAECPVLSVVPWLKSLPRRAVAGIDFSAASIHAAEAALLLLESGGAMTLVYVMPPSYVYPSPEAANAALRDNIRHELERVARVLRQKTTGKISITSTVLDGEAAAEIIDLAEKTDADLVTVGTSGGSAIRRAFVGSVATEVFHSALCSVLASPPPAGTDRMKIDLELHGAATSSESREFAAVLDQFTTRNSGRKVLLEEDDRVLGAQLQAQGYTLSGVTYDKSDGRVNVMLGAADAGTTSRSGTPHLTRSIPDVSSVAITVNEQGNDYALQIKHGQSQTLLIVEPAPAAPS